MAKDIDPSRLFAIERDPVFTEGDEWLTTSSLPEFLAKKMLEVWKDRYPEVYLTMYAPKEDAREPGISWRIAHRVPGLGSMDTLKPSPKGVNYDVERAEVTELHTQHQTVTYEFIIYALNSDELNSITEDFETFLYYITPELQKRHVDNFIFVEELREDLVNASKKSEETYKRVLRYNAYIKKKLEISYSMISRITLKTGVQYQEQYDLAVRRDSSGLRVDILDHDIPSSVSYLTRVSDLEIIHFKNGIMEAEATGGITARDIFISQHLYVPGKDYVLYNYINDRNQTKKAIVWQNNEGTKIPASGTAYYISYIKPLVISDTYIQTGV